MTLADFDAWRRRHDINVSCGAYDDGRVVVNIRRGDQSTRLEFGPGVLVRMSVSRLRTAIALSECGFYLAQGGLPKLRTVIGADAAAELVDLHAGATAHG